MTKKKFTLILDTETSCDERAADFAAIVVDRTGTIHAQCAVLVAGVYGSVELFHNSDDGLWGSAGLIKRKQAYAEMLNSGVRMLASPLAINRWLDKAIGTYNPEVTAYNFDFDRRICENTGIDLSGFKNSFCLWQAAVGNICDTKAYRQFALEHHLFNPPTDKGNMTFRTDAEAVAGFVKGSLEKEPHTALIDCTDFERPILTHILRRKHWRDNMIKYSWSAHQVRDHFKAK